MSRPGELPPLPPMCKACDRYFMKKRRYCTRIALGECECPICQGLCTCPKEEK